MMNNDKVYRVVVVKQPHCRVSTTLNKFEKAVADAGLTFPLVYNTRTEAEEALAVIEEHIPSDLVTKVEYGHRNRHY